MTAFFALVMMISGIFGPQITAGFTDFIFMDEAKINLSLSITGAISLPIAILFFRLSLPHLRNSVVQIEQSAN
jgi:hypothetical protein